MSYESTWQCDLCGKKETEEWRLEKPRTWSEILVKWGGRTRTGVACDQCTESGCPPQGVLKYWIQVIAFLKHDQPPQSERGTKGERVSLDEWIEKYSAVKVLAENLRSNLDALTDLSEEEKDALMRVNMIVVRQCIKDFGVE